MYRLLHKNDLLSLQRLVETPNVVGVLGSDVGIIHQDRNLKYLIRKQMRFDHFHVND